MKRLFAGLLIWLVASVSARASIVDCKRLTIDFSDEKEAAAKAQWSEPERITIAKNGLGWDGDPKTSRDGWFMTTPLALGFSWRPTISASITATIQPVPEEVKLNDGSVYTPWRGQLYVRYSADIRHWSSWQALAADEQALKDKKGIVFSGVAQVPALARKDYDKLIAEYSRMDVPWGSDEEAAVKWILAKNPKYFETATPFVGYVQFLYEAYFYGNQRIVSFSADIGYGMGGTHVAPKDKSVYQKMNIPWRFKAE